MQLMCNILSLAYLHRNKIAYTRNLRKYTPFTPKMKCIHSHAVCSYLENLMQHHLHMSFKKVKNTNEVPTVVHMICALYEAFWTNRKLCLRNVLKCCYSLKMFLQLSNGILNSVYLNWHAVLDCNTCKKMALGFNDVSFSMCTQNSFECFRNGDDF